MSSVCVCLGHVLVVLCDFDSLAQFWGLFEDIFHLGKFSIFPKAAAWQKIQNLREGPEVEYVIISSPSGPRFGSFA